MSKIQILLFIVFISFFTFNFLYGDEEILTNQNVIEMHEMGFEDEILISKINEVQLIQFDVSLNELKNLKDKGVSQQVINAMLKRKTKDKEQSKSSNNNNRKIKHKLDFEDTGPKEVFIKNKDEKIKLIAINGKFGGFYVGLYAKLYWDFIGTNSNKIINSKKPIIYLDSEGSPLGNCFIIKLKSLKKESLRRIRVKSGLKGMPDKKFNIEYELRQENNIFEIIPKTELIPGEYGVLVWKPNPRPGNNGHYVLYDFAVIE